MPIAPETLACLVDLAEDAILLLSEDGRIRLFNRGAERTFGYLAEEICGQHIEVLIPERYRKIHLDHLKSFALSPVDARSMGERRAVHALRKDGSEFSAEITIAKSLHQQKLNFIAILRDVSERVRSEEAIRILNQELEKRVRDRTTELEVKNRELTQKTEEIETFVYSVSHDLRAPLVNLEGFSRELKKSCQSMKDLMNHETLPETVRTKAQSILNHDVEEAIDYIQGGVARIDRIVEALLKLSRAGRVQYEPCNVELKPIVERLIQSFQITIKEKAATLIVHDLPSAWVDITAVEQIFANLIGNALNYLDPKRLGEIEIGSISGEPDTTTIFVRDNGVGIAEVHQEQVFQAFRRLHSKLAPGEGMGLLMVRRMLDRLGGRIWFVSAVGVGTTFYFTLPARQIEAATPLPEQRPERVTIK